MIHLADMIVCIILKRLKKVEQQCGASVAFYVVVKSPSCWRIIAYYKFGNRLEKML